MAILSDLVNAFKKYTSSVSQPTQNAPVSNNTQSSSSALLPQGFNEAEYLRLNPDVAEAVKTGAYGLKSGADHYLSQGSSENRTYRVGDLPTVALPQGFNEQAYLASNPDVAKAVASGQVASGAQHYAIQGGKEGREAPVMQQQILKAPTAYDPTAQINALKEAQKQQALASLGQKRDASISNLNAEQAKITPAYYAKRNEASTASQLSAKSFAEYMANRGQTSSGASMQGELNRVGQLQGDIGSLNQQELAANGDVQRRMTDVGNAYNSDVAAANAGIEANSMNQLIAAQQQAYQNALSQYNADRGFNYQVGRDTVSDNQYAQQFDYTKSQNALAQQNFQNQFDYSKSKDALAQNNWQQQFDYTKLTNQQQLEYQQAQFDYQKQQDAINNTYRQGTFEWQKAMDQAGLELQQKQFNLQASSAKQPTQAQINAQQKTDYENQQKEIYNEFYSLGNDYDKGNWLRQYRTQIINTLGPDEYQKMLKTVDVNTANNIADLRQTNYEQQQDRLRQRLGE
jgi:hypothetical protein